MTRYPDLEIALRATFQERADPSSTDAQFDAILDRAVATRQRPTWLAGLRSRAVPTPATPGRALRSRQALALVGVALAAALLAAVAFVGGPQPQPVPRATASPSVPTVPVVRGPRPNGKIFYARYLSETTLYTIDPDGSHLQRLAASWGEGAVLAPDGLHIVSPNAMFDFEGHDITVFGLSRDPIMFSVIDVSPDLSRYLATGWLTHPDGAPEGVAASIYSVRASDGGDVRKLVEFPQGVYARARFSPDGTTVAYIKFDAANASQLRLIGADGAGDRALGSIRNPTGLDWAPDGQSLLVTSIAGMYIVDVQTGAETLVVTTVGEHPVDAAVWSPDGKRILVLERVGALRQYILVTMDVHGGDLRNVTNEPTNIWFLGWGIHPLG